MATRWNRKVSPWRTSEWFPIAVPRPSIVRLEDKESQLHKAVTLLKRELLAATKLANQDDEVNFSLCMGSRDESICSPRSQAHS